MERGGPAGGRRWSAALLLAVVAPAVGSLAPAPPVAVITGAPSRFVAIAPERVVDTRLDLGIAGPLTAGAPLELDLTTGPVPAGAVAVVATLTVDAVDGPGWLQVAPSGQVPSDATSTLNVNRPGDTVASTVFAPLGTDGRVTISSTFSSELIVDVVGYFVAAETARAGRLVAVTPARVLDTRGGPVVGPSEPIPPATTTPPATVAPAITVGPAITVEPTVTTSPPTTAPTTTAPPTTVATTTTVPPTTTITTPPPTTAPPIPGAARVMLVGDSITKGNTIESDQATYRRHLWNLLTAAGCEVDFVGPTANPPEPVGWDTDNAAISGFRADGIASFMAGWANGARPDVLVVTLGTNDSNQDQSAESTVDDLDSIIESARATSPNVKVVVAAPFAMDETKQAVFAVGNRRLADLRALLGPFAADQSRPGSPVTFVDLAPIVTLADLRPDGIHPSETGDAKIAASFQPVVQTYLGCGSPDLTSDVGTRAARRVSPGIGRPLQAAAGSTTPLRLTGVAGIPAGASTAVLSVTAVAPTGDGWVQVGPAPLTPGAFSSLNVAAGADRANLIVAPIGADGTVELYTSVGTDLVVDVMGYFTGGAADLSPTGLFVPASPRRWYDSRRTLDTAATIQLDPSSLAPSMTAVVANLTATNGAAGVWVQLAPSPLAPGAHSNLNVSTTGHDIAVGAVTAVGASRRVEVHRSGPTDVVVDIVGWFT